MDKVVLDSLRPDDACFTPPPSNPAQPDPCKIDVTFHNREDLKSQQPSFSFQREKDHYILNPASPMSIAILQGLNFDDKSLAVQGGLHFSVFINQMHGRFYPSFQTVFKYSGPDLQPAAKRMDDFLVVGDIQNPDEKQRKTTADLLREVLPYRNPEQDWFLRPLKFLLNEPLNEAEKPSEKPNTIPAPILPRIQWMRDQFKVYDDLRNVSASVQEPALKKKLDDFALSLLIYLNTGEGDLNLLKADLDTVATAAHSLYPGQAGLANLFKGFTAPLESYGRNSFFTGNAEARRRLLSLSAYLKEATDTHRVELLGLSPELGFQKSVKDQINEAANNGQLALRVKNEIQDANLSANWLKDHVNELTETVLPALKLVQDPGKPPRLKVDVATIQANTDRLVQAHYVQAREYRIGVLALLRFLFGDQWSNPRVQGWAKDGFKAVEVDLSTQQAGQFFSFRDDLNRRISQSVRKTSVALPIIEGVVLSGGLAMTIGGYSQKETDQNAFKWAGPITMGVGAGSLLCHFVLQTRNQYVSDGLCGLAGGALGFGAAFLINSLTGSLSNPMNTDRRNPTNGFGP